MANYQYLLTDFYETLNREDDETFEEVVYTPELTFEETLDVLDDMANYLEGS